VFRLSRLYESAPADVTEQPAFLNAALLALTSLAPPELLAALKTIEACASLTCRSQVMIAGHDPHACQQLQLT